MLRNIRNSSHVLLTNGGHLDSSKMGNFPNLGEVWFNRNSIANILLLADVRRVCMVTMDTADEPTMCVHQLNGSVTRFLEHPSGLYMFDATNAVDNTVTAYTIVSTVAQQRKSFSTRKVQATDNARALYRKIGRPDKAEFRDMLQKSLIQNCPVTPDDAKRVLIIYGPNIAVLKGKTTKGEPSARVPTYKPFPSLHRF